MKVRWSLHLFDWIRYESVALILAGCGDQGNFDEIEDPEIAEVLDDIDLDADPEAICNAILLDQCVMAESVSFEAGFAELILWLRRQPGTEDAAELLAALISNRPNVCPWFECDTGLVGILTLPEVREVNSGLVSLRSRFGKGGDGPVQRIRELFTLSGPNREHMEDLLEIFAEAQNLRTGLAAVLED